jgi:hypothetical protein
MRLIPLSQGKFAQVDDADYDRLTVCKWCANKIKGRFYAVRNSRKSEGKRRTILMHCVIMGKKHIDHKDGDGLNNKRQNLRPSTHSENAANRGKNRNNTSGFKGVYFCKPLQKWRARIKYGNQKETHLGYFLTVTDAAVAYDAAAKQYHGQFANVNFP